MSQPTIYDEQVAFYLEFVDRNLAAEPSLLLGLVDAVARLAGDRLPGGRVCDIACGEGYVSRALVERGAASSIAVDISSALIEAARRRTNDDRITFEVGDAQTLATVPDASIDVAVCQMAIMDIPDHRAAFDAAARVVRPGGAYVLTLVHPCFEGPFDEPALPHWQRDADGNPTALLVHRYATEGHWHAGTGGGVRSHVGSHHRMLSTYVNDLLDAGFVLTRVEEPLGDRGFLAEVPRLMLLASARR